MSPKPRLDELLYEFLASCTPGDPRDMEALADEAKRLLDKPGWRRRAAPLLRGVAEAIVTALHEEC